MITKLKEYFKNLFSSIHFNGLAFMICILGALGGVDGGSKQLRRIGIPLIFTICALIETWNLWCILLMSISGWLSIGYGIPSDETDEGSTIGRFWFKIFKNNHYLTDVFSRGTIAFLISLSFLVVPLIKFNWLWYSLGCIGMVLTWAFISWRGFGTVEFKILNKTLLLNKVDMITYGLTGVFGLLIIWKG